MTKSIDISSYITNVIYIKVVGFHFVIGYHYNDNFFKN